MDRRQEKTIKLINNAFNTLLQEKAYDKISVQDITTKANIGRSTFYLYYETKDELVKSMCFRVLNHINGDNLNEEKDHDFSNVPYQEKEMLIHLLFHIRDEYESISGLLSSDISHYFWKCAMEMLEKYFEKKYSQNNLTVPLDYVTYFYSNSLLGLVKVWIRNGFDKEPEQVIKYYYELINKNPSV